MIIYNVIKNHLTSRASSDGLQLCAALRPPRGAMLLLPRRARAVCASHSYGQSVSQRGAMPQHARRFGRRCRLGRCSDI